MKAVRVRIAVAVDKDGNWKAYGNNGMTDGATIIVAICGMDQSSDRYWLEATLEVPEEKTIEADVEKEEKPWVVY